MSLWWARPGLTRRRGAHRDFVLATPPSTLLAKRTQVGTPHFPWRRPSGRRAGHARYGQKHSTESKFLATDLRGSKIATATPTPADTGTQRMHLSYSQNPL